MNPDKQTDRTTEGPTDGTNDRPTDEPTDETTDGTRTDHQKEQGTVQRIYPEKLSITDILGIASSF